MNGHTIFGAIWLVFGLVCSVLHEDLGFVLGVVCANVWIATMPTTQVQHKPEHAK